MSERRENLAELDSVLRTRLVRLDEPVDRSDWADVVKRSGARRLSRHRSFAVAAGGAVLAGTLCLVLLFAGAGQPRRGAAPRPALQPNAASGLILYAVARRTQFLDNSAGPSSGRAATVRFLSGGLFHVHPALGHTASVGPLPGDQAVVSVRVYTTAGHEKTLGSAVLTCQYVSHRTAYCDGAVDLDDGVRLTASGTLDARANHFTLVATGSYGRDLARTPSGDSQA
jgi:hypothetical protein